MLSREEEAGGGGGLGDTKPRKKDAKERRRHRKQRDHHHAEEEEEKERDEKRDPEKDAEPPQQQQPTETRLRRCILLPDAEPPQPQQPTEARLRRCILLPDAEPPPPPPQAPQPLEPQPPAISRTAFVRALWTDASEAGRGAWRDLGLREGEPGRLLLYHALLVASAYAYCFVGGVVFRILEGWHEVEHKCRVQRTRHDLIEELWDTSSYLERDVWITLARDRLREFEAAVQTARDDAGIVTPSTQRVWSFWGSLHYALTVVTSIGYGHIVPTTDTGRALTMVYACVGIPLLLMVLADLGKVLTRTIKFLWAFVRRFYYTGSCRAVRRAAPVKAVGKVFNQLSGRRESQDPAAAAAAEDAGADPPPFAVDETFDLPVSVAFVFLLLYILAGGLLFVQWEEDWSFFQAVYFVFISLSTIGFGDFVPRHPAFMMATFVYLLFGLALTSMCINVIQESLSHTFKKATAKLSSHMGFYLEGTDDAPAVLNVEVASVHKGKST